MKKITQKLIIVLLAFFYTNILLGQTLTVEHTTAGNLAEEINNALAGAGMSAVTDIEHLIISGTYLNQNNSAEKDDARSIKACTNLVTLDISGITFQNNTMTGVEGGGLFATLTKLKTVILPNTVTNIGAGAFRGCSGLESVLVKNDDETISNLFSKSNTQITLINALAFFSCTKLVVTELPSSLENMGKQAFQGCGLLNITEISGFTNVKLQESLFRETGITDFTIPSSVTTLDKTIFYQATSSVERSFTLRTAPPALVSGAALNTIFGSNSGPASKIKVLKKYETEYLPWASTVTVEYLTQQITANITANGTVSVSGDGLASAAGTVDNGDLVSAYEAENITFTIVPQSGYIIKSVLLDGVTITSGEELTIDSKAAKNLTVVFEEDQATSINNNEDKSGVNISPNPTTDFVNIIGELTTPALLFDCTGKKILETTQSTIDMSSLNSGVYILTVNNKPYKVIKK